MRNRAGTPSSASALARLRLKLSLLVTYWNRMGRGRWSVQGQWNRSQALWLRTGRSRWARGRFATRQSRHIGFSTVDAVGRSVGAGLRDRPCIVGFRIAPVRGPAARTGLQCCLLCVSRDSRSRAPPRKAPPTKAPPWSPLPWQRSRACRLRPWIRAGPQRRLKTRAQVFPRNHPVDLQKRLVLGVKTGIPVPKIEKPHLTHQPRLPLSTNRQPDSKSTTPEKGEFLEVPCRTLTLTPKSGPGGSSPMRPERWSCPSWPVPASGSRCSSGAVVGYRRSRCTRIAQPWPRAG